MTRTRIIAGVAFVLLALGFAAPAIAACRIQHLGDVPVLLVGRSAVVQVMLNDTPVKFVLDTGAERSIISEDAARRLGVARDEWAGTTMSGIGGVVRRPNAVPHSFTMGGVPLVRRTLNHDVSLAVVPTLRGGFGAVADGLLGRDFLSSFELELDIGRGSLALMSVQDCSGRYLPWSGRYVTVPVEAITGFPLVIPVSIDGVRLRALLDTGANNSLLAASGMYRLKLDANRLEADPGTSVSGIGPNAVIVRRHRFATLEVGGMVATHPDIWVAPAHLTPIVDMLLGMDWVMNHRLWISFTGHEVFVAQPD